MNNKEIPAAAGAERGHDMRYPHNPLEGFGNGANLDLRVRIALNLLQHSTRYHVQANGAMISPADAAGDALDVAGALLEEAERRGWVAPLEEAGELSPALRAQAKRSAAFGILQQIEGSKFAQDEQARVVPMAPRVAPSGRH
jgi:hypothetical protein